MIECPNCEKTSSGSSCRLCGWSHAATVKSKVPEMQEPWIPPDHREPTPEEDREIRATLAALKNAPWWRTTQGTAALPTVDPAIRAEVARRRDGPHRLADLLADDVKGAPR